MEMIFDLRKHLDIVWRISEQVSVKTIGNNEVISAMLFATINHCDAIQVLIQQRNMASTYALVRPTIECVMRSAWLRHCASELEASRALTKDNWPPIWKCIELVEEKTEQTKVFSVMWNNIKDHAHDFTDGGIQLARRQIAPNGIITPNVSDDEIRLFLRLSAVVSTFALGELIELSNDARAEPLYEKLVNQTHKALFEIQLFVSEN